VRFRLTDANPGEFKRPPQVESLTCLVQLKVPGAGVEQAGASDAPLIVPTTPKGPRVVRVKVVADRLASTESAQSLKVDA
jgi:hypothetical protein